MYGAPWEPATCQLFLPSPPPHPSVPQVTTTRTVFLEDAKAGHILREARAHVYQGCMEERPWNAACDSPVGLQAVAWIDTLWMVSWCLKALSGLFKAVVGRDPKSPKVVAQVCLLGVPEFPYRTLEAPVLLSPTFPYPACCGPQTLGGRIRVGVSAGQPQAQPTCSLGSCSLQRCLTQHQCSECTCCMGGRIPLSHRYDHSVFSLLFSLLVILLSVEVIPAVRTGPTLRGLQGSPVGDGVPCVARRLRPRWHSDLGR